jgi:MFS family permease
MYLSPVTTVMKWFPDQRGLATGMALSAFGAGAAIAPAFIQSFMDVYAIAPDYIGPLADMSKSATAAAGSSYPNDLYVTLTTLQDGTQVVAESSSMGETGQPVVVATAADLAQWPHVSTGPGAYVLGTGDTGTAKAMASLGVVYGAVGMLGSRFMTVPHPDWTPTGAVGKKEEILSKQEQMKEPNAVSVNTNDIGLPVSYVTRSTSQFPLLWLSVFGNATGGLALLSSSKLMLTDIWAGVAPGIVTAPFATAYVSALGVGMAVGRFGWSATSDYLGRKNTYALFGLGIPIVGMAPMLTQTAMQSAAAAAAQTGAGAGTTTAVLLPLLTTFCGGSVLAITFYGGIFSVLPAYIADLFGQKHATAIHGKLLTAWACSAVAGPLGLAYLRGQAATSATHDLLGRVEDSAAFEQSFGCCLQDTETLQTLVDAKTITIGRLMELVPVGTVDPTPFLYDTTCYAAAGLMGVSLLSNMLIQPLNVPKVCRELEEAAATATATATVATNETNKKI